MLSQSSTAAMVLSETACSDNSVSDAGLWVVASGRPPATTCPHPQLTTATTLDIPSLSSTVDEAAEREERHAAFRARRTDVWVRRRRSCCGVVGLELLLLLLLLCDDDDDGGGVEEDDGGREEEEEGGEGGTTTTPLDAEASNIFSGSRDSETNFSSSPPGPATANAAPGNARHTIPTIPATSWTIETSDDPSSPFSSFPDDDDGPFLPPSSIRPRHGRIRKADRQVQRGRE